MFRKLRRKYQQWLINKLEICQVYPNYKLKCSARSDGGYSQCERLDRHGDDDHMVGRHTIEHALSGNGYACSAIGWD